MMDLTIPGRLKILICSRMLKSLYLPDGGNLYSRVKTLLQIHGMVHLKASSYRSEEHTSELQSRQYLVCRLLLEKKKQHQALCRPCAPRVEPAERRAPGRRT